MSVSSVTGSMNKGLELSIYRDNSSSANQAPFLGLGFKFSFAKWFVDALYK